MHELGGTALIGSIVGQPVITEDLDLVRGDSLLEELFKVLLGRGLDLACRKLFLGQCPIAEKEADAVAVEGEHTDCMQVATIDRSRRQTREGNQLGVCM